MIAYCCTNRLEAADDEVEKRTTFSGITLTTQFVSTAFVTDAGSMTRKLAAATLPVPLPRQNEILADISGSDTMPCQYADDWYDACNFTRL